MRIVEEHTLISAGTYPTSADWKRIENDIRTAVSGVEWPPGTNTGRFVIRPTRKGNGVKPIKLGLINELREKGWSIEHPFENVSDEGRSTVDAVKPGDFDAALRVQGRVIAVEWETGNISSSHRALNKMTLGLLKGRLAAGTLIVPSKKLYPYLTDRVGNIAELLPYFDLWKALPIAEGILRIIVIEHDATDATSPLIPKGTDGRAKG